MRKKYVNKTEKGSKIERNPNKRRKNVKHEKKRETNWLRR
jgi:hypothetical protein